MPALRAEKGFQALAGFRGIKNKNSRHLGHGRSKTPIKKAGWSFLRRMLRRLSTPASKAGQGEALPRPSIQSTGLRCKEHAAWLGQYYVCNFNWLCRPRVLSHHPGNPLAPENVNSFTIYWSSSAHTGVLLQAVHQGRTFTRSGEFERMYQNRRKNKTGSWAFFSCGERGKRTTPRRTRQADRGRFMRDFPQLFRGCRKAFSG